MNGTLKHIFQEFPAGFLSEVKFIQSANGIATEQFDKIGARFIYYNYIYILLPPPTEISATVITFKDQFGSPLFSCYNKSTSGVVYAPLFYSRKGTNLKISCSDTTIQFSVSYQYIYSKDKVDLPVSK